MACASAVRHVGRDGESHIRRVEVLRQRAASVARRVADCCEELGVVVRQRRVEDEPRHAASNQVLDEGAAPVHRGADLRSPARTIRQRVIVPAVGMLICTPLMLIKLSASTSASIDAFIASSPRRRRLGVLCARELRHFLDTLVPDPSSTRT